MKRWLLLFAVLFAWMRPLEAELPGYDDAYYARKALEVIRTGDWLGLPFNGSPTFDNPPLGIWAQSASFLLFGASPAAARFPSAAYGVLTALVVFLWIRRRNDIDEIAFLSAALFICNPLYLKYLRRGMLEMGLLFWTLLALWAAERRPLSKWWQAASGFLFGLAFLTKSALSLVVPAGLALGWILEGRYGMRRLQRWALPALAGFSAAVVPWLLAMHLQYGESFLRGHFGWLLWGEGLSGVSDTARLGTLAGAAVALLPLSGLFAAGAARAARDAASGGSSRNLAPLALAVVPLALLTLLGPRKLWYFMALLPGMAAVCGSTLAVWTSRRPCLRKTLIRGLVITWSAAVAFILAFPIPLHRDRTADVRAVAAETRARIGPEQTVWFFFPGETCRWDARNAFLWHADRKVVGCQGESASFGDASAEGAEVASWVVTSEVGERALAAAGRPVLVWFERGDLKLLSLGAERG